MGTNNNTTRNNNIRNTNTNDANTHNEPSESEYGMPRPAAQTQQLIHMWPGNSPSDVRSIS